MDPDEVPEKLTSWHFDVWTLGNGGVLRVHLGIRKRNERKTWVKRSYISYDISGQIITTSAEVTLNGGLIRELPQNPLNSGLGIILICPDIYDGLRVLDGFWWKMHMGIPKNRGRYSQIIHLFIGFSTIFTIHFQIFPYFWKHPNIAKHPWSFLHASPEGPRWDYQVNHVLNFGDVYPSVKN